MDDIVNGFSLPDTHIHDDFIPLSIKAFPVSVLQNVVTDSKLQMGIVIFIVIVVAECRSKVFSIV